MALTDVYCRVNRARGLELLSPEDLIQACHMLEKLNLPIRLREFDSGVKVLQLQSHSDANVVKNTALAVSILWLFTIQWDVRDSSSFNPATDQVYFKQC